MNVLPSLLHFQGKLDEAEPLYRRSLAMREKALGQDHPDVATSLNNIAALLENKVRDDLFSKFCWVASRRPPPFITSHISRLASSRLTGGWAASLSLHLRYHMQCLLSNHL